MKNVTKERSGVRPSDQDAMEKVTVIYRHFMVPSSSFTLIITSGLHPCLMKYIPIYQNLHTTSNYKCVTNSKNTQISSFYEKNQNLKKCGCFFLFSGYNFVCTDNV